MPRIPWDFTLLVLQQCLSAGQRYSMQQIDRLPLTRAIIEDYATKYWGCITDKEKELEEGFPLRVSQAHKIGHLDRRLFLDLAGWKSRRPRKWQESNSDDTIKAATSKAFLTEDIDDAILALTALSGIALRSATALLHWMHPHRFPLLDIRAVSALGENAPKNWEDIEYYKIFTRKICGIRNDVDLDLRTIDRALWTWDKLKKKKKIHNQHA